MFSLTTIFTCVAVAHVVVLAVAACTRFYNDKQAAAAAVYEEYELRSATSGSEKGLIFILKVFSS